MQRLGTPANPTSLGTSSTSNSQAVQTPGQSNSVLIQGEPPAGTQPSLLSGEQEQGNESIDGNTPLSAVINLLSEEIHHIEVVKVAAQTLGLELPPSYTQNLGTFEDIARVAELPEVARQYIPVNTVQHLLPPFYQASTETGLESGDSATREDSVETDDGASTELDTSHGESTTKVATPAGSTAAGPRNDAAQAFIAAAASAGIKLGPMPEPNARPKSPANAPRSQQPVPGPSTHKNPASPAFAKAQRLNPRSEELLPSGAPFSDHLAGHGLNPAAASFQPAAQQLDPTTATLFAGYQAAVQGGVYAGPSGQASGEQSDAETGAGTPGPWLSPQFPPNPQGISFDGDERGNGAAAVAEPAPEPGLYGSGDELPPDPPLVDLVYPSEIPPGWQIAVTVISDEWAEYVMWEDPDWEPEDGEGDGSGIQMDLDTPQKVGCSLSTGLPMEIDPPVQTEVKDLSQAVREGLHSPWRGGSKSSRGRFWRSRNPCTSRETSLPERVAAAATAATACHVSPPGGPAARGARGGGTAQVAGEKMDVAGILSGMAGLEVSVEGRGAEMGEESPGDSEGDSWMTDV